MGKTGRPKKEVNQEQFEKLCGLQCTEEDIIEFFKVGKDTLIAWCKRTYGDTFQNVFKQKRQIGKISLRRSQFKLSEKSPAMAIFLGKQYLGQKDNVEVAPNVSVPSIDFSQFSESDLNKLLQLIGEKNDNDRDKET